MTRQSEYRANKHLSASKHGSGRKRPEPERRGWLEAILIGLIVAVCIAGVSFAGQWLDSIDFAEIFK